MKGITTVGYFIVVMFVIMFSGCYTDHSRHFTVNIEADGTDPWVELDVYSTVEKADNREESTATTGVEGQATIPINGVTK